MVTNKKNKIYLIIMAFILIVFAVAGVSFALFTYSRLGQTTTTIHTLADF